MAPTDRSTPIRIDFVSDVVCPWCVIGLKTLQDALRRTVGVVRAELHLQPFELNPDMPAGGENLAQRLERKFGWRSPIEMEAAQAQMRERAAAVGFDMASRPDGRIYNTFDAHRLIHWAGLQGRHVELKEALFTAYFTRDLAIDDPEVLAATAQDAGLPADAAREVVVSGRYADEVRTLEARWRMLGINSAPSIVFDHTQLVVGAQPPEVFEHVLRDLAAG